MSWKENAVVILCFVGMFGVLGYCSGCKASEPTSPAAKKALEESARLTYVAEHLACVKKYSTDPEIDACRDEVRRRWGVVETVTAKDGGQ